MGMKPPVLPRACIGLLVLNVIFGALAPAVARGGPCEDGFCCKGDVDSSGTLSGRDVQTFVGNMLEPAPCGTPQFCAADVDDNGLVDVGDVDDFVGMILAGDPCPPPPDNYCPAGALDEFNEEFISRVVFGTLNNPSLGNSPGNYQDFTGLPPPSISLGVASNLTVTISEYFSNDLVKTWVDWNRDGDFEDAGEEFVLVDSGAGGTGTAAGPITPPAGTLSGPARMRIRLFYVFLDEPDFGPCGQSEFGEVEDYRVNLVP